MAPLGPAISRFVHALAILALVVVALLPAGLLPRVAGRCGRALCECPAEKGKVAGERCHVKPLQVLTFGETGIKSAPVQIAFQLVLTGIECQSIAAPVFADRAAQLAPQTQSFALLNVSPDITTPPPKA